MRIHLGAGHRGAARRRLPQFCALAIALCRALGIPARYVSAYAWRLDPPDFHAVVEAWLQGPDGRGGWYLFDPARISAPKGIVRIGVGRDAAEAAFSSPSGPFEAEKPEVRIAAAEGTAEAMDPRTTAVRPGAADRRRPAAGWSRPQHGRDRGLPQAIALKADSYHRASVLTCGLRSGPSARTGAAAGAAQARPAEAGAGA